jgi:hypothetical protein
VRDDSRTPRSMPDALEYQRRTPETTVLYRVVQQNLETFLASAQEHGRVVPRFVERELRAFLDCGILARGFLRVRCKTCGDDRLVAFSCNGRGFCPSCTSRRMSDTAAVPPENLILAGSRSLIETRPQPRDAPARRRPARDRLRRRR